MKKQERNKEEKAIVLEISGAKGNLDQYKRELCEAHLLHIHKVMICSIWDEEEEMGIHYTEELIPLCESLGMAKVPFHIGYAGELFDGEAMVVTLEESRNFYPVFSSLVSLEEYKKEHGAWITQEEVHKVFEKIR